MKYYISIFDESQERRSVLKAMIDMCEDISCVGSFSNLKYITDHIETEYPDLIFIVVNSPICNTIQYIKIVKNHFPKIPIIVQSECEDDDCVFSALKAGVNGYILNNTPPDKLIYHIRETLDGGAPMSNKIAVKVLQYFREYSQSNPYKLSNKELEVLTLLVDGLSQKLIAQRLNVATRTISNHVNRIYQKLKVHSATEAVSLALKKKLI